MADKVLAGSGSGQENKETEIFPRYIPQHPLPEEIKKLARDDTVCKYCGVSYLIHNEIKALEEKLKLSEKELAILRGQEKREELLKQDNEVLHLQRKELQDMEEANNQLIGSLNKELDEKKELLKKSEDSVTRYQNKYMSTLRQLSTLSQIVRHQKKDLQDVKQKVEEVRSEVLECVQSMGGQVTLIKERSAIETSEKQSEIECLQMEKLVLKESNKNVTNNLKQMEKSMKNACSELEQQKLMLEKMEAKLFDVEKLNNTLNGAQKSLQDVQSELDETTAKCKTLTVELDQYKIQLRVQLELKSKEGELVMCLKQLKALENKCREQQRKESEREQQSQLSQNETRELKENLKRTKADVEALKAERELMIEAHQNRIEDLRESFKNKMAETENWPQKLQAAVSVEKTRHLSQMKTLEEKLKRNFVLELQIEKDKYNELLKKYQDQEKDRSSKRDMETAQLERMYRHDLEECQRQSMEAKRQAGEREDELNWEIHSLKNIISGLQDRMARLDGEDTGKICEIKSVLAQREQELSESQAVIDTLGGKAREANQQAQFLQNIVRKECEERFELTEALSEARKELLQLKRPPGGYTGSGSSKRGSLSSLSLGQVTPPATVHVPDDPLLKLRSQVSTNNINIGFNNGLNSTDSRNSSGKHSTTDRNSSDPQLIENRKRIANMMGRIS